MAWEIFRKQNYIRPDFTPDPEFQVSTIANRYTPRSGSNRALIPFTVIILDISNPPPPLTLFVNPSVFNPKYSKVISSTYSREGYVSEHWGDSPEEISVSGVTGGTYTEESGLFGGSACPDNSGTDYRLYTAALQEMKVLLMFYKNNGRDFRNRNTEKRRIDSLGIVALNFDLITYLGYFSNFSYKEVAEKPHNFEYNFSFIVYDILNERNSWVRPLSAGAPLIST